VKHKILFRKYPGTGSFWTPGIVLEDDTKMGITETWAVVIS